MAFFDWRGFTFLIQGGDHAFLRSFIHRESFQMKASRIIHNRAAFLIVASLTGPLLLGCHGLVEPFLIHGHALFLKDFIRHFPRKTKGIIKFKGIITAKDRLVFFFHGGNLFIQQIRTLGKGLEEACFLHIDDLVNEFLLFHELRVMLTIHGNDLIGKGGKELAPNAKETSMTDGTAQNAAQDIASSFIGRKDSVPNHEGQAASMISNNLKRNIGFGICIIFLMGEFASKFDDGENKIGLKV